MGKNGKRLRDNRIIYFDYLRILATLAVIMIHVVSACWNKAPLRSTSWLILTGYDGIVRWAVPIFVMISGALFLDNSKKLSMKDLYGKYILRIVTAFLLWSSVYALWDVIKAKKDVSYFINHLITGEMHMWFLFMIAGLYILTPVIRKIVESENIMKYFLIVIFISASVIPVVFKELAHFNSTYVDALQEAYNDMHFYMPLGYVGYFIVGYYLANKKLSKKMQNIIYILGIIGTVLTIVLVIVNSNEKGNPQGFYYNYLTPNVVMQSISVFVFAKYKLSKIKLGYKSRRIIFALSKYSFGVYLVHIVIRKSLQIYDINALSFPEIISVPVLTIAIFVLSLIISVVLNKIPFVKKYFV